MMKTFLLAMTLLFSTLGFGQIAPYVKGGLTFSNSGYQTASPNAGAGVQFDFSHFFADTSATYILARKTDDNTIDNHSGHVWQSESLGFLRTGKYLFGGGIATTKLNTSNYEKSAYNPEFGGGREWQKVRLTAVWYTPGNDRQNDEQGVRTALWVNPRGHLFARIGIGVNFFHDTVTDPNDLTTTASEKSVRHVTESVSMQAGWRF